MNLLIRFTAKSATLSVVLLLSMSLGFSTNASGQIAQVGTATTATTATTTLTINKPSGLALGNIMFANIIQTDNDAGTNLNTNATRSGWTVIAGNQIGITGNNESTPLS